MFTQELELANSKILEGLKARDLPLPDSIEWQPIPFKGQWGFGTPVFFQVAGQEAKEGDKIVVQERALELASLMVESLKGIPGFDHLEATRGYLNLYINPAVYAQRVIDTVLQEGDSFGKGAPKGERIMVEYTQPNTHHSFHIGHARNTVLGESLARLVEFAGFETIRASYPGDLGLGVITCMWAYQKFYKDQEPEGIHERGQWLAGIYAEANSLVTAKDDETLEEQELRESYEKEIREMYQLWDEGDPAVRELWRKTRQWSLDELNEILRTLKVEIDVFFYESQVDEPAKEIVEELILRRIADDERPDGPVIVKIDEKLGLKKEKYRTVVVLRSDGTTLYLTGDLALAKLKFEEYKVDRSIYVVDVRQSLHFQQVFKILELLGFEQAKDAYHLAHGFVTLKEGAMSARAGNIVFFKDVLDEAKSRVLKIIAEKNPDLPESISEEVAQQVGLGALTYSMLSVDNHKDIVFEWDTALSFDGRSAPYIQNAHVRASSILKKADSYPKSATIGYELHPFEIELIERISRFPTVVQRSAGEYKPLHMAIYAYRLAKSFHAFYHEVPVLGAETEEIKDARLRLTEAARQTLALSLNLLAISAPQVM